MSTADTTELRNRLASAAEQREVTTEASDRLAELMEERRD